MRLGISVRHFFPPSSVNRKGAFLDALFWPRSIGLLIRVAHLADPSDRAWRWCKQAMHIARERSLPPRAMNCLMGEATIYLLANDGSRDDAAAAFAGLLKLLDIDLHRWLEAKERNRYEADLLCDISARCCDLLITAACNAFELPREISSVVNGLYRQVKTPPWDLATSRPTDACACCRLRAIRDVVFGKCGVVLKAFSVSSVVASGG